MTVRRRAGAPRLIEWTGERCVPWAPDIQVVYEHLHRYLWAAGLVAGRRVLDLASGEGFGAAILSETAAEVVGVDVDATSVEHASLNYVADNVRFEVADARDLSAFADGEFEAVVAFEMIEHVDPQERVFDEIKRVLSPDGLLIISTPDREAYGEIAGANPYHVRELSRPEFAEVLGTRFAHTAMFGQHTVTGSALSHLDGGRVAENDTSQTFFVERDQDDWRLAPTLSHVYLVAVASHHELPALPRVSSLADAGIELVRAAEGAATDRVTERMLAEADRIREELERQHLQLEARLEARTAELQAVTDEAERIRARAAHDAHTISALDASLNAANHRLRRVEGSVTWQLFQRARGRLFGLLGGEDSRAVGMVQTLIRFVGRRLHSTPTTGARRPEPARRLSGTPRRQGPIDLNGSDQPTVSIVIPLYARADLTRAALESIRDHTEHISHEVILVDDAADPATKALLAQVRGARVLVNESNVGYLRSVQRGAAAARGRWLVLCNNDIEVQPGWLPALLDCGESASDIAIVAPKYLYPDGTLAEAGGVIWRDGTGCNYGRGQDPSSCHYDYRREIDYGSAAALLVRTDFWHEVGGFDERFLPMYYEDADLCFEARARGLRVMYEPRARVIHVEGATAGVDETAGHKRYQEINRPKFVEKWRERLESEHLVNGTDAWLGANLRRRPHVLVVDHRIPQWDREAGALRMRGMLEALLNLGCHVTFLPDNGLPMEPYTRELQRMGVEVLYRVELPQDLIQIAPSLSLVILSRPQTAARWLTLLREHAADAFVVYDTVDLHWLREARQAAKQVGMHGDELIVTPKVNAMRELELGLIRASDATIVVTDAERAHVQLDVPDAVFHIVPTVNAIRARVPGARGRAGVLFVGGFEHPPNVDAALALVNDVMPLVWRELADVAVTIVGTDPPPDVLALAGPLVRIAGWIPDLDPLLDSSRALVAPLTFGAGLKGKITQALSVGLPVVTTSIGAEGLDADDGEQLLIAEDPEQLATRVIAVLTDDELWAKLSSAGQELAADLCSPAIMSERMAEVLERTRPVPIPGL